MNCFAHALPFLGNPFFVAGTCLPDWLSVINRKVRIRRKKAILRIHDDSADTSAVARGVVQHHDDDQWFHETAAFALLNLEFSLQLRDRLVLSDSLRTRFVAHILIEMLLDDYLHQTHPGRLQTFYQQLEAIPAYRLKAIVEDIAGVENLPIENFLPRFIQSRFVFDYQDDGRLLFRLNQVMTRVGLPGLPQAMLDWLPSARTRVFTEALSLLPIFAWPLRQSA